MMGEHSAVSVNGVRSRTRRRLLAVVLGALTATTSLVAAASPAYAAGSAAPDVRACFTYNGGAYANLPIHLYQAKGNQWVYYRSGRTNGTGCGTWADVQGNTSYYAQAYYTYRVGSAVMFFNGTTPAAFVRVSSTDTQNHLPTSPVYGPFQLA
ncbi:hypothetical protein WCD74_01535 [Actinomycetospora sp. OC33-EN08]|uniref:Uncharacterized protein n=1 Tax=Actinomycetospora aurantiaca TaxID=3129233 RepID=A0ABU8MH40_9PSEU